MTFDVDSSAPRLTTAGIAERAPLTVNGARPFRAGPESDLVDVFLRESQFATAPGARLTFFREPKLLSGFPDLVAVKWNYAVTTRWLASRAGLGHSEIRLLHCLATMGPVNHADLLRLAGSVTPRSLDALSSAGVITRNRRGEWKAAPLRRVFAVQSIVAFEAKVSSWTSAIEQAQRNQWFASASYVVAPAGRTLATLIAAARERGVGVWIAGEAGPILRAKRTGVRQPVSYASWLFNEWAWRASAPKDERVPSVHGGMAGESISGT